MQTFTDEITLPETKPETGWIAGRAAQKVLPTTDHGIFQKAQTRRNACSVLLAQPEMIAQTWAAVGRTEQVAPLQFGHDEVDELGERFG